MIFIVEPGGWASEKAIPARARTAPVRGLMNGHPGVGAAERCHRRALERGGDGGLHRPGPARRPRWPARRWPASSRPPKVPASRVWKIRSRPSRPDVRIGRIALGRVLPGQRGGDRSQRADDLAGDVRDRRGRGPGPRPAGCRRRPAARLGRGMLTVRRQALAGRAGPGTESRAAKCTRASDPLPLNGTTSVSCSVPRSGFAPWSVHRRRRRRGRACDRLAARRGWPWRRPCAGPARTRARGMRRWEARSRRLYICARSCRLQSRT